MHVGGCFPYTWCSGGYRWFTTSKPRWFRAVQHKPRVNRGATGQSGSLYARSCEPPSMSEHRPPSPPTRRKIALTHALTHAIRRMRHCPSGSVSLQRTCATARLAMSVSEICTGVRPRSTYSRPAPSVDGAPPSRRAEPHAAKARRTQRAHDDASNAIHKISL